MLSNEDQDNGTEISLNVDGAIQKPKLIVATASERGAESAYLVSPMYDIRRVFTAEQVLDIINNFQLSLIFIDKSTDDVDGISLLRALISNNSQSLVLVRSETDDEIDRIVALELGADDCVHSSCGPRELKARVSALLRRYQKFALITANRSASNNAALAGELVHKGWILNRSRCQLYSPTGDLVNLTSAEFEIISSLFSEPGVVKDRLSLRNIAVNNKEYDVRTLDVSMSRLRKKMALYGGQDLIETIRGRGYRLSESIAHLVNLPIS